MRVDKLVQFFAKNDHLKDLNVDNVLGSEGHLACAFGELIKKYYSTPKKSLSPIDVIRIIAKNPQFRGSEHQDSQ
jgi:ubiquitin C-terminal hydrolase